MIASQNGWSANRRDLVSPRYVPGTRVRLVVRNGAAGDLLLEVAALFDLLVQDIDQTADDWGYAERPIRGSTVVSNHASGTAIDLNAPAHPQGVAVRKTFTPKQISAVSALLARYHGLIVWGGTWDLPDTDGMHFEGAKGSTPEQVTALAATLAQHPAPPPPPPPPAGGPDLTGAGLELRGAQGAQGPRVHDWQQWLAAYYPAYRHACGELVADGVWGPVTTKWNREFAQRSGITSADGLNIGPKLAAAYWAAGLFRPLAAAPPPAPPARTGGARDRVRGHLARRAGR